jgi:hypothetical protein
VGRARRGGGACGADAIVGVTSFSDLSPGDFGSFDRAFVALFRIPGGDAWVDSLPYVNDDGTTNMGVVVFLYSFILVVNWTLLPITLAILVNNFVIISTDVEKEESERAYREKKSRAMITYPLDPLVEYLTKQYVDDVDLTDRLQRLFKARGVARGTPPSRGGPSPPTQPALLRLLGWPLPPAR